MSRLLIPWVCGVGFIAVTMYLVVFVAARDKDTTQEVALLEEDLDYLYYAWGWESPDLDPEVNIGWHVHNRLQKEWHRCVRGPNVQVVIGDETTDQCGCLGRFDFDDLDDDGIPNGSCDPEVPETCETCLGDGDGDIDLYDRALAEVYMSEMYVDTE